MKIVIPDCSYKQFLVYVLCDSDTSEWFVLYSDDIDIILVQSLHKSRYENTVNLSVRFLRVSVT